MVEDIALFGVADCRRPPGMAEEPGQVGNFPGGAPNPPYTNMPFVFLGSLVGYIAYFLPWLLRFWRC